MTHLAGSPGSADEAPMEGIARSLPPTEQALSAISTVIAASIGFCFLFQLHLAFTQPINWDEFRFLADVHRHARGDLDSAFQTFHVHLFRWLTLSHGDEVDQITQARLVMLAMEVGTVAALYTIARHFFDRPAALFAALSYISFGFVLRHGASFRFDPISTFLLMSAAAFLLAPRLTRWRMAGAGAATAIAGLVTVKSVFYLPLLLAAGGWRLARAQDRKPVFSALMIATLSCFTCYFVLYLLHSSSIAASDIAGSQAEVARSFDKTLGQGLLLPRWPELARAVLENPVHWLFLLLGVVATVRAAGSGPPFSRLQPALLLAFTFPLATLIFYRNAFPYYYAFILAPACVLAAAAAASSEWRARLIYPALAMTAGAFVHYYNAVSPVLATQRATVDLVHRMFNRPVAYIDRCSMIGSFPQVGFFMSTWGLENYRQVGRPVMRDFFVKQQAVFLIANSPVLEQALTGGEAGDLLLPEDRTVLRDNLVHHWGAIWVTGKTLEAAPATREFEILVAGRYTVEASEPVLIDGEARFPGEVIFLSPGPHHVRAPDGARTVVLRWGERLSRPTGAPPSREPLFTGF